ncbi:MAG TPA: TonB-dependent receptor [Bryobacteraceae bacterium]|nr:TonB-dependent receptor [Bryobacteraceae bacterium]
MLKSVLQYGTSAFCLLVFSVAPGETWAQVPDGAINDSNYGEIHGITRRTDREPVPGAQIRVHSVNGSSDRAVSSNGDGSFYVPNLDPGVYELRASKAGFTEAPKTVVEVGSGKVVKVELIVDSASPFADTSANAPPPQAASPEPPRRAPESPLDGIYPSSDYLGPTIGVRDTDPIWPLTQALWDESPALKKAKIKIYGWLNPGGDASTSKNSNVPESYAIVPNKVEMDQAVLRIERVPDTVQTDNVDWGFRLSTIYGIDYRYTTAQGWFSGQLLKHNSLYGADPVEAYGLVYVPGVAQGMVIQFGRYISPPDIEAQLAPSNYLFTHSLMFTVDCYTQTGINASIKLNDRWSIQFGVHAGDDVAPWNAAAQPTGMLMLRWVSKSNNDSFWGGIDAINTGRFKAGHDDLQQDNLTWTHRFNKTGSFLTSTEAYYIYQSGALVGGTVNNGPPRTFFEGTGAGAPIAGNAPAIGLVNYTEIKLSKRNFLSLRPIDILDDKKGERTGFATTYESWTVGVTHRFSDLISVRPELRYEYAYSAKPYDNGTRNHQLMFAVDAIIRF